MGKDIGAVDLPQVMVSTPSRTSEASIASAR
jgi:hypothetical protein